MGCVADECQSTPHDDSGSYDGGDSEVKMTRPAAGALCRPQRGTRPEAAQVPRKQHAGSRPPAGLSLEPVHLKTAGGIPRDLASKPATFRPNQESWDFDKNEQDFGEEKNPPKPHANP
jgi:hypothetical protein